MSEPDRGADFAATASAPPDAATITRLSNGTAAVAHPLPPAAVGFTLLEEIGHGGMGVVFKARDVALDREVAVKLLQDRYGPDSAAAVRFVDEARITGQLQHPGIPAVYQVGQWDDGRPFLAMKLIKGKTLDRLLKDAGPDATRWLGTFESVCHAVGFAHARGVIHRDLKPANVMVGSFGEVQVMDWGLAKVLAARREKAGTSGADPDATSTAIVSARDSDGTFTVAGSVLGTPAFMPPEQAAGEIDKIDARADVFGLGAILCVLLTGRPPVEGENSEGVRLNAVRGKTEAAFARLDASGAAPELVALCKACLAFEPGDRPAAANAVADAVAALRQATDERARQADRDKLAAEVQAGEQRKRRRAVVVAAGVVVAVFAAGAGAALWQAEIARQKAKDAERARGDAEEQRKRAQARLDKAVQAVEIALTRTGSLAWMRPEMQPERRAIVEEALAFFRTIGEEDGKEPAVRRQVARAQMLTATAYMSLSDYDKCEAAARAAAEIYAGLVAEFPDDMLVRRGQVDAVAVLGQVAAIRGLYGVAEKRYNEALELGRAARRVAPASAVAAVMVADIHTTIALFNGLRRPDLMLKHHGDALKIGEELLAARPDDFQAKMVVFTALVNLASNEMYELRETARKFDRAAELLVDLDRVPPPPGRWAESLQIAKAAMLTYRGSALYRSGKRDEGLASAKQGNELIDGLRAISPKSFSVRVHWMEFRVLLADLYIRHGRVADAEKVLFDEVRREQDAIFAEDPSAVWLKRVGAAARAALAIEWVRAGRCADAEAEIREVMLLATQLDAADGISGNAVRYNAACTFAQLAVHGPEERRGAFATEAVRLLDRLTGSGYYRVVGNAAHTWIDPDLDPLRDRADYLAFVERMRAICPAAPPPRPLAPPPRPKPER